MSSCSQPNAQDADRLEAAVGQAIAACDRRSARLPTKEHYVQAQRPAEDRGDGGVVQCATPCLQSSGRALSGLISGVAKSNHDPNSITLD